MDKKERNKMLKSVQNVSDNPFVKVDEKLARAGAYAVYRFCKTSPTCGADSTTCPIRHLIGCNCSTSLSPKDWGNI